MGTAPLSDGDVGAAWRSLINVMPLLLGLLLWTRKDIFERAAFGIDREEMAFTGVYKCEGLLYIGLIADREMYAIWRGGQGL